MRGSRRSGQWKKLLITYAPLLTESPVDAMSSSTWTKTLAYCASWLSQIRQADIVNNKRVGYEIAQTFFLVGKNSRKRDPYC